MIPLCRKKYTDLNLNTCMGIKDDGAVCGD